MEFAKVFEKKKQQIWLIFIEISLYSHLCFQIKHIRGILVEESDGGDKEDDDFVEPSKAPLSVTKLTKVTKPVATKPKLLNGTKLFTQAKSVQLGDDAQLVVVLKSALKNETDDSTPPRQRLLLNRAAKNRWSISIDSNEHFGWMECRIDQAWTRKLYKQPIRFSCDIDKPID